MQHSERCCFEIGFCWREHPAQRAAWRTGNLWGQGEKSGSSGLLQVIITSGESVVACCSTPEKSFMFLSPALWSTEAVGSAEEPSKKNKMCNCFEEKGKENQNLWLSKCVGLSWTSLWSGEFGCEKGLSRWQTCRFCFQPQQLDRTNAKVFSYTFSICISADVYSNGTLPSLKN